MLIYTSCMGTFLELVMIHLVCAKFYGDLTSKVTTAATYRCQGYFQALLAATVFLVGGLSLFLHLVRMRNGVYIRCELCIWSWDLALVLENSPWKFKILHVFEI